MVAVVEGGAGIRRLIPDAVSQVGGERWRVDDLTRIEEAVRIERPLDGAKGVVELRAKHTLYERSADQAVAMLARERPAELKHQVGDLVRDRLELSNSVRRLHVHNRSDVQATDRRVGVDPGRCAVPMDHGEEPLDEVAQFLRRHGRVLDKRDALSVPLHRHRQAKRRFA